MANPRDTAEIRTLLARAHAAAQARRFAVEIAHPDGHVEYLLRQNCHPIDAANDGMDRAGLGGVVRVLDLDRVA